MVGAAATSAGAWPGDPDGGYGRCGARTVDVAPGLSSSARAVSLSSQGKVLAAGAAGDAGLVMRFSDGAPDSSFAGAGAGAKLVKYSSAARFDGIAPTGSGGAVAVGRRARPGNSSDSVIARVTATGAYETSFHGTGRISVDVGGADAATAVAVAADGGVFVGGNASAGGYVLRYTAAGALDSGWSGDGRATGLPLSVRSIAIQPDGAVLVGGATTPSPANWRILRLASDGTVDSGFGGASGVTVDLGGHDVVTGIALQSDGKLVAAGFGGDAAGHGRTIVRRYQSDGTDDSGFDHYSDSFGISDTPVSVAVQPDGKVLVAANSRVGTDNDVVLVRLLDDGSADAGFGIDGATVSDLGRRSTVGGAVVALDGHPLAVGSMRAGNRDVVAAFRYQDDGASAPIPAQGVVVDSFGGVHGWSAACLGGPTGVAGNPYWPGWDIVRGVAALPGSRGLEVDAYGAAHGFTWGDGTGNTPVAHGTPYWPGWDIVRGIAVLPNGSGGYELDGFGGLHPFSIGSGATPKVPKGTPYWPGLDIARGLALMPDGKGGYVVDSAGVVHAFGGAPAPSSGAALWAGQDVARGIALAPDGSGGWILDRSGGMHAFATGGDPLPPAAVGGPYWPGASLARGVAALP
ncbi:MAG: hypothetical protein ACXVJZ_10505 [Acidimicrobiia bacterium]